jgi:predicted MPP superfamily phosphohydrolase
LGILGNHDFLEIVPTLERLGLRMLLNERVSIVRGSAEIVVAGVDDPHFYGTHDLARALGSVGKDRSFTVLLAHSPEIVADAEKMGVGLYLCGHTHGGQICLPGGLPIIANASCGFRFNSGAWSSGRMRGYTSRGTGFSTAAARFFCPPEIALHTLTRSLSDLGNCSENSAGRGQILTI